MRAPMLAGILVALAVGGAAAFLASRGSSPALPPGASPAATPTAATTTSGAPAPLAPAATSAGGSGAVLANEEAHYPTPEEIRKRAEITHVLDYVCKKQVPIESEHFAMHMGATYKFCSKECRAKFEADPLAILNQ